MHSLKLVAGTLFGLAALSTSASASYVINTTQQGTGVLASGAGTIDLTDLTPIGTGTNVAQVDEGDALLQVGVGVVGGLDVYSGISGPASFGPANVFSIDYVASSSAGNPFAIAGAGNVIGVPGGYVSGALISGTGTFDNTTIAGLGLTLGTYTYTWGTGVDADSIVINIGGAVPEPSTWAMMLLGFAGIGAMTYRRRNSAMIAA
jgi:hypothetical protein